MLSCFVFMSCARAFTTTYCVCRVSQNNIFCFQYCILLNVEKSMSAPKK